MPKLKVRTILVAHTAKVLRTATKSCHSFLGEHEIDYNLTAKYRHQLAVALGKTSKNYHNKSYDDRRSYRHNVVRTSRHIGALAHAIYVLAATRDAIKV